MPDIKTLAKTRDVDLVDTFTKSLNKLTAMLSSCDPIPSVAGETLHLKKITGKLSEDAYVEGEEIPISNYTWEDLGSVEVKIVPFRKQSTLQEIKKRGYAAAVDKTDAAMLSDIQAKVKEGFLNVLSGSEGALTTTGANLVATAANMWALLSNQVEKYGFGDVEAVFFVNPVDFAKCIGDSEVFAAFGINYIENWSGLGTLVSTGSIDAGTVCATTKKNVKVYAANAEGDAEFGFYTDESGYIAIQHAPKLTSLTYDTVCYMGVTFFAEYVDFIVKGTIAPTA